MKIFVFLAILMASAAGFLDHSQACVPVVEFIQDYRWEPPGPISVCVLPDGAARTYTFPGQEVNAVLQFRVEDWVNAPPFPAVPVEWWGGGPEVVCEPHVVFLPSDSDGWVTWTPDLQGGGHRGPDEAVYLSLWVPVCPNQQLDLFEGVFFNSPDINGDLKVDLVDIQLFAGDFFGNYDYRSDFNWDGLLNLTDIPPLAQHYGHSCP
jgi:hypothetical protein